MKKSLFALAVLGLSSAAMAQSSVTLFGVADAGIGRNKTPAFAAYGDNSGKTEFISSSSMNNVDSYVGVRGVEDLGGGMRAGFWLEAPLDMGNGAIMDKYSGGGFWSRSAFVYLGGNWGTVKLGRALNPSFLGVYAWELTSSANYTVVGNAYGYASNGPRTNSQFSYKTPSFSGFTAELGYVTKNDRATSTTVVPANKAKWDMNVIYSQGPIAAAVTASKVQTAKTQYSLGGRYNFGNFIVAASYSNASRMKTIRRGFGLGGTAIFGAFSATVDLTRDTKNQWVATGKKYTNYLAELKYSLSKRTFLYGAYLRMDGYNNYSLGVRHNF